MEEVNCALCGSNDYVVLETKTRFGLDARNVVCKKCGLVYINPRMTEAEYDEFYKKEFHERWYEVKTQKEFNRLADARSRDGEKWIIEFAGKYLRPNSMVLDVGCGPGILLDEIRKEKASEVVGIEPAEYAAEYASQKLGIDVFGGLFDDYFESAQKKRFDFIFMLHVLEHFLDPVAALKKVKALLKDDGYVYIGVPNVMRPSNEPTYFFQISHPYNYSPHTLNLLLQKAGFEIVKLHVGRISPMDVIATHARHEVDARVDSYELASGSDYHDVVKAVKKSKSKYAVINGIRATVYKIFGKDRGGRLLKLAGKTIYKLF